MMQPVAWFAVVRLAIASLLTGVVQALSTPWGLVRHYWVLISLVLTTIATTILLLHLPATEDMADVASNPDASITGLNGDLFHSVGGLAFLLVPLVLNIYKPRGLTRSGLRAQQREHAAAA